MTNDLEAMEAQIKTERHLQNLLRDAITEIRELRLEVKRLKEQRSGEWVYPPFDTMEKLPIKGAVVEFDVFDCKGCLARYTPEHAGPLSGHGMKSVERWRYIVAPTPPAADSPTTSYNSASQPG